MDRDVWLEERRTGIGGSDIAALVGVSPYGSPRTVWHDKMGFVPDKGQTDAQKIGLMMERVIVDLWMDWAEDVRFPNENVILDSTQQLVRHPEVPYFVGTPDAVAYVIEREDDTEFSTTVGVDFKNLNAFNKREWLQNGVPDYYYAQVQWYMMLTGAPVWHLACLFGGVDFEVFEVDADFWAQFVLIQVADEFWNTNVRGEEEPEATAVDLKLVREDQETEVVRSSNGDEESLLAALRFSQRKLKRAQASFDAQKAQMIQAIGGDAGIEFTDGTILTNKANKNGVRTFRGL